MPLLHRTDRMTAAVNNLSEQAEFQKNYQALLRHYGLEGRKIQTGQPNENGDVEQRHYRFQRALEQALLSARRPGLCHRRGVSGVSGQAVQQLNGGRQAAPGGGDGTYCARCPTGAWTVPSECGCG